MPDWMGWWVIVKAGLWIAYSKKQIAAAQQIGFPCNKSSKKLTSYLLFIIHIQSKIVVTLRMINVFKNQQSTPNED